MEVDEEEEEASSPESEQPEIGLEYLMKPEEGSSVAQEEVSLLAVFWHIANCLCTPPSAISVQRLPLQRLGFMLITMSVVFVMAW